MTGMSKVAGGNAQPMDSHSQVEEQNHSAVKDKQKNHYNFHGGHQHGAEKERLKKLLRDVEKMLASHAREEDDGNKNSEFDKIMSDHAGKVITQLKQQYNLNDDDTGSGTGTATATGTATKVSGSPDINDTASTLATQGDIVLSGGISVLYLFMNLLSDLANFKYIEMQQKAKVSRDAQNMANEVNEIIADVSKQKNSDTYTEQLPTDVIKYMEDNDVEVDNQTIDQYLELGDPVGNDYDIDSAKLDGKDISKDNIQVFIHNGKYNIQYKNSDGQYTSTPLDPSEYKVDGDKITIDIDASKVGAGKPGQELVVAASLPDRAGKKLDKGGLNAVKSALENASNRASDFVSQSQLQLQKVMQTYNVTVSLINSMQTLLEEMNKSIAQNIR